MMDDLSSLLVRTVGYGVAITLLRIMMGKSPLSASLAFWFGWSFLIGGGLIAYANNWTVLTTNSMPYLVQMFDGAFVGFLLASFTPRARGGDQRYWQLVDGAEVVLRRVNRKVTLILFVVGSVFLLQRIATVGFGEEFLTEVRNVYNERDGGLLPQVGSHLSVLMIMLTIMRGIVDS